MNFTFAETVKLATKGFKPSDVAELSKLDEDKFSKDDILSLIANGYSKSEVKNLVDMFSSTVEDTMGVPEDNDEQPDTAQEHETADHSDAAEDPDDKKDDIDYKSKYEEEKKLREQLQHKNAAAGTVIRTDGRTDFDIAREIAEEYY